MLARRNRLVSAADYRATVRRGRRQTSAHVAAYWSNEGNTAHPRVGFIVSRAVGNAVARNLVRRRLKSIAHMSLIGGLLSSSDSAGSPDVVLRALPGAAQAGWATLETEVTGLIAALGSTRARTATAHTRTATE